MSTVARSPHIEVRSSLDRIKPGARRSPFNNNNGKRLSGDEAREMLMDELVMGHEVIPMSRDCANPCPYTTCTGFNYGKGGGCPGRDSMEELKCLK